MKNFLHKNKASKKNAKLFLPLKSDTDEDWLSGETKSQTWFVYHRSNKEKQYKYSFLNTTEENLWRENKKGNINTQN